MTIDFAYATIVSIKPIKKGEKFTKDNIWVKRPGKNGILAEFYDEILGKEAIMILIMIHIYYGIWLNKNEKNNVFNRNKS